MDSEYTLDLRMENTLKKDTCYALLGLLFTSAGALLVLWLVFVSRNPDLFPKEKSTNAQVQEEWQIGEYNENLFPTSILSSTITAMPEEIESDESKKLAEQLEKTESGNKEQNDVDITSNTGAGRIITEELTEEIIAQNFYMSAVSEELKERILQNLDDTAQYEQLLQQQMYVHVLHYDFDENVRTGELLVYTGIAQSVLDVFQELFVAQYPIEKIKLVSEYGWDDTASMQDNNTSAFNFRTIAGTEEWSKHALGMAIDINPLYNPYVYRQGDCVSVQPRTAGSYADRSAECAYYIQAGDVCYEAFISRGFSWGGDWENPKDYQHFQVGKE